MIPREDTGFTGRNRGSLKCLGNQKVNSETQRICFHLNHLNRLLVSVRGGSTCTRRRKHRNTEEEGGRGGKEGGEAGVLSVHAAPSGWILRGCVSRSSNKVPWHLALTPLEGWVCAYTELAAYV